MKRRQTQRNGDGGGGRGEGHVVSRWGRCYPRSGARRVLEPVRANWGRRLLMALMASCALSAGKAGVGPPSEVIIDVDRGRIGVAACQTPLWLLLERIEEESGVRIGVEAQVGSEPVCVDIQAETWGQVLEALLEGYAKIVVHEADGSVSRVLVLNQGKPNTERVESPATGERTAEAGLPGGSKGGKVAGRAEDKAGSRGGPLGAPGAVPPPADPSLNESQDPSVFLRDLVAPPDLAELPSPPAEGFFGAEGGPALGRDWGSVTVAGEHPSPVVPPPDGGPMTGAPQ